MNESVEIRYGAPDEVDSEVRKLEEPWIGDEGPLVAELWHHSGGELPRRLHPRGLAFDHRTTVLWDEDAVQVIRPRATESDVIARRSEVLIRDRFPGLHSVERTDYLRQGVLIASRYTPGRPRGGSSDA